MPKYYRFRATTPTRKPKRSTVKENSQLPNYLLTMYKFEAERSWMDLTFTCTPAQSWYLRRTSWRESRPLMGLPKQLATGLRTSLQLSNRPTFVFKVPTLQSHDIAGVNL